ncbi:MAG: xanthine dehydrogenase family protein subunit M [Deltaproteobacteria bacterium]|nr:xanthine dehydrogenase family protein subunit M [Deltaproteobacteria bacterium]
MMPRFAFVRPESLREAVEHLASPGARIHAGGTDLLGCLRDGVFEAEKLVGLSRVKELRGIRKTPDGGLRIGALASIREIAEHTDIRSDYQGLAQAADEVASPQLRNQGTLGGNLCQKPRCWYYRGDFPCLRKGGNKCYAVGGENDFHCILGGSRCFIVHPSDTAPALLALGARVRIAGPGGVREVPLKDLYVPPATDPHRETVLEAQEVLVEVLLPPPAAGPAVKSSYRKVRARRAWDFALAGVALALDLDGREVKTARVVLSGAAPVPWRSEAAEAALVGKKVTPETARDAADAAMAGARPLRQNAYKLDLFRGLIREEVLKLGAA